MGIARYTFTGVSVTLVNVRIITRPSGAKEFTIADHLGSTRATFSSTGEILERVDYEPFGGVLKSEGTGARTGYIDREEDSESGLGFYGVRQYESEYGRFVSVDRHWQDYTGQGPYHYALNSPVLMLDFTGFGVDEVNKLFAQIKHEADNLFSKAVNVMIQSNGETWEEHAATMVGNYVTGFSLVHEVSARGTEAVAQVTEDGSWDTPLLTDLKATIHTHSIPKTIGEPDLFDNIPPSGTDVFSTGIMANKGGETLVGFVTGYSA